MRRPSGSALRLDALDQQLAAGEPGEVESFELKPSLADAVLAVAPGPP